VEVVAHLTEVVLDLEAAIVAAGVGMPVAEAEAQVVLGNRANCFHRLRLRNNHLPQRMHQEILAAQDTRAARGHILVATAGLALLVWAEAVAVSEAQVAAAAQAIMAVAAAAIKLTILVKTGAPTLAAVVAAGARIKVLVRAVLVWSKSIGGSESWRLFLARSLRLQHRPNTSTTSVCLTKLIGTTWPEYGHSLSLLGTS
jgi:hypothetical protein